MLNPKTGAAAASNIATVASISTPTPQTVTLQLTHPDFSILYGLTTTNLSIMPAKAVTAGTIASQPDGTGPFKFVSWSPGTSLTLASNAQAVTAQSDLAKVGIHMTIDNLGENDYIQRWLKGQFQAAFAENGANPDPYIMYGRYFGPGANLAVPSGYSSPALASLLTNADQNPSAATRASLYDQISTYLTNNAVWIWLFDSYDYTVLASSVHGYTPLPNEQLSALATTTVSG